MEAIETVPSVIVSVSFVDVQTLKIGESIALSVSTENSSTLT